MIASIAIGHQDAVSFNQNKTFEDVQGFAQLLRGEFFNKVYTKGPLSYELHQKVKTVILWTNRKSFKPYNVGPDTKVVRIILQPPRNPKPLSSIGNEYLIYGFDYNTMRLLDMITQGEI